MNAHHRCSFVSCPFFDQLHSRQSLTLSLAHPHKRQPPTPNPPLAFTPPFPSAARPMSHAHSVRQLLGDSGAQVAPGLIIGDKRLASNLDALQSLGITHVVNATVDVRNYFENYNERAGHLKMEYLRCPWSEEQRRTPNHGPERG